MVGRRCRPGSRVCGQEGPLRGGGRGEYRSGSPIPQEGLPEACALPSPVYTDPQGRLGTISSSSPLTPHSLGG